MTRSLFDLGKPAACRIRSPADAYIADVRQRHPGMVLLFHVGDRYELFGEDARLVSKLLGLPISTDRRSRPLVGFPSAALEVHLRTLLHSGCRVAICDSMEDPA